MKLRDKAAINFVKTGSTSERLQQIMRVRGISQAELARKVNLSRGAISNYLSGRYEPKTEILYLLAKALDCSFVWLHGYNAPMEESESIDTENIEDQENPWEIAMLDEFNKLDSDHQLIAAHWVKVFAENKNSPSEFVLTEGFNEMSAIKKELILFADELNDEQAALALRVLKSIVGEPE